VRVVVARTVQIARHGGPVGEAVLAARVLAQLRSGDLRERVALVGAFEGATQEGVLADRLREALRVDGGTRHVQQFRDTRGDGATDDRGVDQQVVEEEVGGALELRLDAGDLGRRVHDRVRCRPLDERRDRRPVREVGVRTGRHDELVARAERRPDLGDARAEHPGAAGEEDAHRA
jgi:hypothetical protein